MGVKGGKGDREQEREEGEGEGVRGEGSLFKAIFGDWRLSSKVILKLWVMVYLLYTEMFPFAIFTSVHFSLI